MKTGLKPHYYRQCLQQELALRLERNPRYSMRSFARALGIDSSALSQIISGKRLLSERLAKRMFAILDLAPEQQERFLDSLAHAKKSRGLQRISPALRDRLQAGRNFPAPDPARELTLDTFRIISDWHHYAILELTQTEGFRPDPRWIASQLGISATEAELALDRLRSLELLSTEGERWAKTDAQLTTADKHLTTPALRRRQKQILEKSIQSLENDPIEQRCHQAMTLAIDPDLLPEARRRVDCFLQELTAFLESGKKSRVYEMSVSLFPLQRSPES